MDFKENTFGVNDFYFPGQKYNMMSGLTAGMWLTCQPQHGRAEATQHTSSPHSSSQVAMSNSEVDLKDLSLRWQWAILRTPEENTAWTKQGGTRQLNHSCTRLVHFFRPAALHKELNRDSILR